MASKLFRDLVNLRPPGHSHPIGTMGRRYKGTATLSYMDSSGEVVFGPETTIVVEFAWRELPPEHEGSGERRVWVGFEVQARDQDVKDFTAVLATHPYSTDWFDWADFKRTLKRSREERERVLREPTETVKERLRSRTELSFDALETSSGVFTARLSTPMRTVGLGITSPKRLSTPDVWVAVNAVTNGRYGRDASSDLWCFGACGDFDRCRELLRVSERALRLLDSTRDGTLFLKAQGSASSKEIGASARALAKPVLESCIIKALAGESPRFLKLGSPKSVSRLMEAIYLDTMYNLARRLREPESGGAVLLKDIERTGAAPEGGQSGSLREQIDFFRRKWEQRRPPEEMRYEIEKVFSNGTAEECTSACAVLISHAKRLGTASHVPWRRV